MAHFRAVVTSKGGECSRLGNKAGMSITVDGQNWRLSLIVGHSEGPNTDYVFIAQVDKDTGRCIGEVTRLDFPLGGER